MIAVLRGWPPRRWVAAAVGFPLMAALFAATSRTGLPGHAGAAPAWTWPWLAVTAALAALVLASYLAAPGTGKLVEVGCSPCAAVSALAVGGAVMAHAGSPASPLMAVVATVLTLAGLRQRLGDATACATSPRTPASGLPSGGPQAPPPARPRTPPPSPPSG